MLAVLDKLGLQVDTDVVQGQRADDNCILRLSQCAGESGAARAAVCGRLQDGGLKTGHGYRLVETATYASWRRSNCSLPCWRVTWSAWRWDNKHRTHHALTTRANGNTSRTAKNDWRPNAEVEGNAIAWTERRLVVRSRELAVRGRRHCAQGWLRRRRRWQRSTTVGEGRGGARS